MWFGYCKKYKYCSLKAARIVQKFPGNDGRVRIADVKLNNTVDRKSINDLCLSLP